MHTLLLSIIYSGDCLMAYGVGTAMLISALIAAASASANAAVQKKASDEQKRHNDETQRRIDSKAAQDNAWYRMQYYRDPLRSSSGAHMLATIRDYNKSLLDRQRDRNVITGGTHESEIASMDAAMRNYGKVMGDIKALDDRQKMQIGAQWQQANNANFARQLALDDRVAAERQTGYANTAANINNFAAVATQALADGTTPTDATATQAEPAMTATPTTQSATPTTQAVAQTNVQAEPIAQTAMAKVNAKNPAFNADGTLSNKGRQQAGLKRQFITPKLDLGIDLNANADRNYNIYKKITGNY